MKNEELGNKNEKLSAVAEITLLIFSFPPS